MHGVNKALAAILCTTTAMLHRDAHALKHWNDGQTSVTVSPMEQLKALPKGLGFEEKVRAVSLSICPSYRSRWLSASNTRLPSGTVPMKYPPAGHSMALGRLHHLPVPV